MKTLILLLVACLALPVAASAQDEIFPPPVGGGGGFTRTVINGQEIEITTVGPTQVEFIEISATRVRGRVVRMDTATPTCSATILWRNTGLQQTITVDIGVPHVPFSMESGDIDKRNGSEQSN